jgi:hypothetical protein
VFLNKHLYRSTILAKLVVYISCSSVYFRGRILYAKQEDYSNREREQGEANNGS